MPLIPTKIQFPTRSEMTEGTGAIRLGFAAYEVLAAGEHQVSFRNDHQPEIGAYLANVLLSKNGAFEITGQQRDRLQHELQISFRISSASAHAAPGWSIFLILVLFSILLITQWKRLGIFYRR